MHKEVQKENRQGVFNQLNMASEDKKLRVCVIGAGPSGMSALYHFAKLGVHSPEVVCYEKDATWGGQWNYTWRTGINEHGESVCSGIYGEMWVNIPKETMELAHFTFDQHFGKPTQSYFSASVMKDYLIGYWKSAPTDLFQMIRFNTSVFSVRYNPDTDNFTVITKDLIQQNHNTPEVFSHVIVASGHLSRPHIPEFKGFNTFPGRILHSHDFKGGKEFKRKRLLIIGAMASAQDVAIQCFKHGADHVIISWRTKPRHYNTPENIEERPLLTEVNGNIVSFKDGSKAEVDAIVLCTGYMYTFPFLEDSLRLEEKLPSFFPENLYKGVVWCKGGNNKLLYLGALQLAFSFPYFEAQAVWIVRYITGMNPVNITEKTEAGINVDQETVNEYLNRMRESLTRIVDEPTAIQVRIEYIRDIADDTGYVVDIENMGELLIKSLLDRIDHFLDYRNFQFTSVYTKKKAEPVKHAWLDSSDDSLQAFV